MKEEDYCQVFSNYDQIRVQYTIPIGADISIIVRNEKTGTETILTPDLIQTNSENDIYNVTFEQIEPGCYSFSFYQNVVPLKLIAVSYFKIKHVDDIESSILFTCTNDSNLFDAQFQDSQEEQFYFNFRVEGGFIPSEMQFNVDAENFRDQRYSNTQLSAFPYKIKRLTIGNGKGVPYWVAEKINWILACSEVKINGLGHVRSDGSAPELVETGDRFYPKYVYKIDVEESDNTPLLDFTLGSTEWILRNGYWQDGIWTTSGYWKSY